METNRLCDYGCGQEAKFQLNNGKWCCSCSYNKCSFLRNKNSEAIKKAHIEGRCIGFGRFIGRNVNYAWARGLTKETDERIKNFSETIRKLYKDGKIKPSMLGRCHTEKTKKLISDARKKRGSIHGTGRGKHGWYKGYWCDSSWELAWVIYNLEHDIKFERNTEGFEYEWNGGKHKYYPDFIVEDGSYMEIKGYTTEQTKIKIASFKSRLVVLNKKEMKPYIDYAENKYGKDFIKLYDGYVKPEKLKRFCKQCGFEISFGCKSSLCKKCVPHKRKIENRPSKEELEIMVNEMPMTKIGEKYGVSDNAVKKWCKNYGIQLKNRLGYWTKLKHVSSHVY